MHYNLGGSGRFSQFALSWLSAKLLGGAAVEVLPLLLLALALGFGAWALRGVGRLVDGQISWLEAAAVTWLGLISAVATAPSLYDTVAWSAAVVAYLAGLVAALAVVALCVTQLAAGRRCSLIGAAALALLAAVTGGFHELVGTTLTLAGLLAMLTARDLCRNVTNGRLLVPLGATTLGAAIGAAANVLGPGAQARAGVQGAHISLVAALRTAANNLSFLRADAHDGVLLIAFAAGVLAWQSLGSVRAPRSRRWLGAWTAFLLIAPWLITAALTAWGGSTESGNRSPFRAAFIGTSSVALGIAAGVWLLLSIYPALLSQTRATLLSLLLAAAGTIGLAHEANPILRAEAMRANLVNARAASIKQQLAAGDVTIKVTAAPLLTVATQAYDLSFAPTDQQRSGWVSALMQYYGIPSRDRVSVNARQPRDYCLPGVAASWVGVQSCQELHRRG